MSWIKLAERVDSLEGSATVAVATRAKALKAQGKDVVSFGAGEPDFDTPEVIKQAAIEALQAGKTKYEAAPGPEPARQAIAKKLQADNGLEVDAKGVVIVSGAKAAFFQACFALLGDMAPDGQPWEVIVPTPAWVSYEPIVKMCGGSVVEVDLKPEDGFVLRPEALRKAVTARTRMVIVNTPSNPCGAVYSREALAQLAEVLGDAVRAIAPNLVVVTDEIYEKLVFDGLEHASIGAMAPVKDRTLTINALSKSYAMTGWRVGYAAATGDLAAELIPAMARIQAQTITNITSFLYPAISTAFDRSADDIERFRCTFEARRDLVMELLGGVDGIETARPQGAMYAFPRVAGHYGKTSKGGAKVSDSLSFCEALLEEQGVAMVPGGAFGGRGDEHVRISYACSDADIRKGIERLGAFVSGLR
ncbi:MAG: pyridoxal phosphate-dependent aminotransferase [Phycisphaerales bacterium]|jgi:aspartate aminotransferase